MLVDVNNEMKIVCVFLELSEKESQEYLECYDLYTKKKYSVLTFYNGKGDLKEAITKIIMNHA